MNQNLWGRLLIRHEIEGYLSQTGTDLSKIETFPAIERHQGLFRCHRCNNQNSRLFAILPNQKYYCTHCIQMGRITEGDKLFYYPAPNYFLKEEMNHRLTWRGELSVEQKRASKELVDSIKDVNHIHLIHAVTGAGKTEMIFQAIEEVLKIGGRVCIASPRIDVCLELFPRIQDAFQNTSVIVLYGDMEEVYTYTDIVIATTHQLLRFKSAFNLLIVDEVDAFPYVNDPSLHFAVRRSVKENIGKLVYLTATPDKHLENEFQFGQLTKTVLPARYHGYSLPVPEFIWVGDWRQQIKKRRMNGKLFKLLSSFCKIKGRRIIFMPNIALAEKLLTWLKEIYPSFNIACVHSNDLDRKIKVQKFRDFEIEILISTTILERGVTFENCHVCVVGSEHTQFTVASLVQISGRVGRKVNFPTGTLIFAHFGHSKAMKEAKKQIQGMNKLARKKGLIQ